MFGTPANYNVRNVRATPERSQDHNFKEPRMCLRGIGFLSVAVGGALTLVSGDSSQRRLAAELFQSSASRTLPLDTKPAYKCGVQNGPAAPRLNLCPYNCKILISPCWNNVACAPWQGDHDLQVTNLPATARASRKSL